MGEDSVPSIIWDQVVFAGRAGIHRQRCDGPAVLAYRLHAESAKRQKKFVVGGFLSQVGRGIFSTVSSTSISILVEVVVVQGSVAERVESCGLGQEKAGRDGGG